MTKNERAQLLAYWKSKLNLCEWIISLHSDCCPSEMCCSHAAGKTEWETVNRYATIMIMAEKYHEVAGYYDYERTLVHELLHLKFSVLWDNLEGAEVDLLHQHIEDMARALVGVKRSTT